MFGGRLRNRHSYTVGDYPYYGGYYQKQQQQQQQQHPGVDHNMMSGAGQAAAQATQQGADSSQYQTQQPPKTPPPQQFQQAATQHQQQQQQQQGQVPLNDPGSVSGSGAGGGLLDTLKRKVREVANGWNQPYDPYRYAAMMGGTRRYGGMQPHMMMAMGGMNEMMAQQQQAAMMQQANGMMAPGGPYAGMDPMTMMQQTPFPLPMQAMGYQQQPMVPGTMPIAQSYMNPYAQPSYYGASAQMNPQIMMMMMQQQQQQQQQYAIMSGQQIPYDPYSGVAAAQPYGYDPYAMYYQPMSGYEMGTYNPAIMGPMSMVDPTYGRRYYPERNHVSSVKDLWQANYY